MLANNEVHIEVLNDDSTSNIDKLVSNLYHLEGTQRLLAEAVRDQKKEIILRLLNSGDLDFISLDMTRLRRAFPR